MTVCADPLARIFDGHDHSVSEFREIIVGSSQKQRLLIDCFTDRGETVRIFSVRNATTLERQDMKKPFPHKRQRRTTDEMRTEYRFDYAKTKPNRFMSRVKQGAIAVILDPEVASVFLFFSCRQYVPSLSHRDVT